jgi:hypothetical protein
VAGPILGSDFLKKFKVTVVPEINQIQFACTAAASPAPYLSAVASPAPSLLSAALSAPPSPPTLTLVTSLVPIRLPAATTYSQPPAISAHVVWNPKVKSSSFSLYKTPLFRIVEAEWLQCRRCQALSCWGSGNSEWVG